MKWSDRMDNLKKGEMLKILIFIFLFISCNSKVVVDYQARSTNLGNNNILISDDEVTLSEGETYQLRIKLESELDQDLRLLVKTEDATSKKADGSFKEINSILVLSAGDPAGWYDIPLVETLDNSTSCEDARFFRVKVFNADDESAGALVETIVNLNAESDLPSLSFTNADDFEGSSIDLNINLDSACAKDISFDYFTTGINSSAGVDYTYLRATHIISAGQTSSKITITTLDDTHPEQDELVALGITNMIRARLSGSLPIITIKDNDGIGGAVRVAAGADSTCAIGASGEAKCWGDNSRGKLGQDGPNIGDNSGEMGDELTPIQVGTGLTVKLASRSLDNICVIVDDASDTHDDKIKCWGNGEYGKNGYENTAKIGDQLDEVGDNLGFVNLGTVNTALDIANSNTATCAVLTTGDVKCWGDGRYIGKANGSTSNLGDDAGEMGNALPIVDLGTNMKASAIAAGINHFCVILDDTTDTYDGYVKCWGDNSAGQLGIETTTKMGEGVGTMGDNLPMVDLGTGRTAKKLALGHSQTCALLDNDKVKCWGDNGGTLNLLGYLTGGNRGGSPGDMGDNLPFIDFGPNYIVSDLAVGYISSCAVVTTDNVTSSVKCWGASSYSQRLSSNPGDGSNWTIVNLGDDDRAIAVMAGLTQNCALLISNEVKCWGRGNMGINGQENSLLISSPSSVDPIDLGTGAVAVKLIKGGGLNDGGTLLRAPNCAILNNGDLKCWGQNYEGKLLTPKNIGDETSEMGINLAAINLGAGVKTTDLTVNEYHTCAVTNNQEAKCWGRNGSLSGNGESGVVDGFGDGQSMSSLPVINLGSAVKALDVEAAQSGTCFLSTDFDVRCVGSGFTGIPGKENSNSIGDAASEMGDNLTPINLGTDKKAMKIKSGGNSICALLNDQTLKCWGYQAKQLGYGDNGPIGKSENEMGDNLDAILLSSTEKIIDFTMGNNFLCALLDSQRIKCWGDGEFGVLGRNDGSTSWVGDSLLEMGDSLPFVDLGSGRTVKNIWSGPTAKHVCALLDNNDLKCWGRNTAGQLGLGDASNRGDAINQMGDNLEVVDLGTGLYPVDMSMGENHTCAILNTGDLKCWGSGRSGQLGHENTTTLGDSLIEMGDSLNVVDLNF